MPWPCSNILTPGSLRADAIRACFILAGFTSSRFWTVLGENHVFAHFLIKNMKIRLFITCKSAHMYFQSCFVSTKASLVRPVQDKREHAFISAPASEVTSFQPSTWLVRTVPQRATAFYTKFIRKNVFSQQRN